MLNPYNCHTIQLPHREWIEGYGIPWVGASHTLQVLNPYNCHTIQLPQREWIEGYGIPWVVGLHTLQVLSSLHLYNVPWTLPDLPGVAGSC